MIIDTHAHVSFSAFKDDYKEVLDRAKQAGVLVINVGTQLDTSAGAVKMAEEYGLYAVIGLHPVHTYEQELDEEETHFKTREEIFDYQAYKKLALNSRVVGIGECGLDYYRLPENEDVQTLKEKQKQAFIQQIKLAKELNKALVIHCRPSKETQDAYVDILMILDEQGTQDLRFEIHSFTGFPEIVKQFLSRGAYVGLNGIITFDKTGNMEEVIKVVPLERIVLETDCPYLTPVPMRGKKNEPAYIQYVAQKLAESKDVSVKEVELQTSQNAQSLFGVAGSSGMEIPNS